MCLQLLDQNQIKQLTKKDGINDMKGSMGDTFDAHQTFEEKNQDPSKINDTDVGFVAGGMTETR
jgi:hypothetical protein